MYVWQVTNLTLKRNHFYRLRDHDVFITGGAVGNGGLLSKQRVREDCDRTVRASLNSDPFHFR